MQQEAKGSATTPARDSGILPFSGLSAAEVAARRQAGQVNVTRRAGNGYLAIIRENVFTFINGCLFGLGLALVILGRVTDALISVGVMLFNIAVGLAQEIRAKRMLDRISLLSQPHVIVARDGQEQELRPDEIVVGDILRLAPGEQIIADGAVLQAEQLAIDEALLTGEAAPVEKQQGDTVSAGTYCVAGRGYYEAQKVGASTLASQLAVVARTYQRAATPLQQQMHIIIRLALAVVVYLEFLMVFSALVNHIDIATSVQNSTVIAGLAPNGLFLSISVAYAVAAVRIIRYGALAQHEHALELLSYTDVLCLDKTGTLTANQLQAHDLAPLACDMETLGRLLGIFAASASVSNQTNAAIARAFPQAAAPLRAEVPFSSARKWSALAFDAPARPPRGVYVLGAPEILAPALRDQAEFARLEPEISQYVTQGLRALLFAFHPDPAALHTNTADPDLPQGLRPLGVISLRDTLRPEASATLLAFRRLGIHIKIISGDHPETVRALARQAGFAPDERALSGAELDALNAEDFAAAIDTCAIFGRVTPQQKERIVRALRERGRHVAMIGDGVNDILSLKRANVGVAMQSGSKATRSVADLILLRDSFASLAPALAEGQRIINGMENILNLYLTRIGMFGLILVSSLAVGEFPLDLRQSSVVIFFTVGIPSLMLVVWAQPGPQPRQGLARQIASFTIPPVILATIIGVAIFYGVFLLAPELPAPLFPFIRATDRARPLALAQTVLAVFLTFCGLCVLLFLEPPARWWEAARPRSADTRPAWLALSLMVAFLFCDITPPLRSLFALHPMDYVAWLCVAVGLALWLWLVRWSWRANFLERFLGAAP